MFEKLAALKPSVGQMVAALSVVLAENGEKIVTREDFELLDFERNTEGKKYLVICDLNFPNGGNFLFN